MQGTLSQHLSFLLQPDLRSTGYAPHQEAQESLRLSRDQTPAFEPRFDWSSYEDPIHKSQSDEYGSSLPPDTSQVLGRPEQHIVLFRHLAQLASYRTSRFLFLKRHVATKSNTVINSNRAG